MNCQCPQWAIRVGRGMVDVMGGKRSDGGRMAAQHGDCGQTKNAVTHAPRSERDR